MNSVNQLAAVMQRLRSEIQRLSVENAALRSGLYGFAKQPVGPLQRKFGFMSPENLKQRYDFLC